MDLGIGYVKSNPAGTAVALSSKLPEKEQTAKEQRIAVKKAQSAKQKGKFNTQVGGVYDNCWVLDGRRGEMKHGLTLKDPVSGRTMEVWTTEAGIQMYTAEHWNPGFPGKTGPLTQYGAIAIEPQNLPDAPSHRNFPSAELRPGEVYRHRMEWRFFR